MTTLKAVELFDIVKVNAERTVAFGNEGPTNNLNYRGDAPDRMKLLDRLTVMLSRDALRRLSYHNATLRVLMGMKVMTEIPFWLPPDSYGDRRGDRRGQPAPLSEIEQRMEKMGIPGWDDFIALEWYLNLPEIAARQALCVEIDYYSLHSHGGEAPKDETLVVCLSGYEQAYKPTPERRNSEILSYCVFDTVRFTDLECCAFAVPERLGKRDETNLYFPGIMVCDQSMVPKRLWVGIPGDKSTLRRWEGVMMTYRVGEEKSKAVPLLTNQYVVETLAGWSFVCHEGFMPRITARECVTVSFECLGPLPPGIAKVAIWGDLTRDLC